MVFRIQYDNGKGRMKVRFWNHSTRPIDHYCAVVRASRKTTGNNQIFMSLYHHGEMILPWHFNQIFSQKEILIISIYLSDTICRNSCTLFNIWLTMQWTLNKTFIQSFIWISQVFIQENAFQNVICTMAAILFRPHCMPRCVNLSSTETV